MKKVHLLIDVCNIMYRNYFGFISKSDAEIIVATCHSAALNSISKYYNAYKPTSILLAFDDYSWRKAYTSDLSTCITDKKYKGTRRTNLTDKEKQQLIDFDQEINQFYTMMRTNTALICAKRKMLEADDIIAGYIKRYPDDTHIIISSDKDFLQLVCDNVILIDPATDKPRTLEDWNMNKEYFMFEKCFKGDSGDNVMSAYPRLRNTKILASYSDDYLFNNLMQHTFTVMINAEDGGFEEKTYLTKDVFEENSYLMDLTKQPDVIKRMIEQCLTDAIENKSKFNYMAFLKFCGKYKLPNISKNLDRYIPILSLK